MKILILNPNTTVAMTDRLVAVAERVAAPGTELVAMTAARGVPYIATRAEAQIAGALALEMIAECDPVDAVVIAAFGDPGLAAARELFAMPVVGMAEASILAAMAHGRRFSIVTFSSAFRRWYEDAVEASGLGARCVGVFACEATFRSVDGVREECRDAIVAAARESALRAGADVVILGGAPLAGLAQELVEEVGACVVDPISAAVLHAEMAVRLGARPTGAATHHGKDSTGLSAGLSAALLNGGA